MACAGDMGLDVDFLRKVGVQAALQHLAKAINIAFQTDYGETYLESIHQAAIVRAAVRCTSSTGSISVIGDNWFGTVRLIDPLCCS